MGTAVTLFKGFVYLIGFGSILFITYITTRFIGGRANKVTKGKYINMIDTVTVGLNKQLHLVKVGEQFVLIASSGKNIEFLTNVNLDNYEVEKKPAQGNAFDFKNLFDKYFQNLKNRKNEKQTIDDISENDVPISVNGSFKSNLKKLRVITSKLHKSVNELGDEKANEE